MSWYPAILQAWNDGEMFRLAMLLWAAAFGIASGAVTGLKIQVLLTRRRPSARIPVDAGPWLGIALAFVALAFMDFSY